VVFEEKLEYIGKIMWKEVMEGTKSKNSTEPNKKRGEYIKGGKK